jgi:hypothetical protein
MKQVRETQIKSMVNTSKTSLDETVRWMYAGGETMCETMCETRDETYDETSDETCKRKMKGVPEPTGYIRSTWQIVTVSMHVKHACKACM